MNWAEIRREFESTEISLSNLADKYGIKYPTIKSRKQRENWQKGVRKDASKNASKAKKDASKKMHPTSRLKARKNVESEVEENPELTEKQKFFCLYFIKNHNATMAAIKAGYAKDSAHVEGSRLLRNDKVAAEIKRLKGRALQELYIDAMDILEIYAKIGYADITDVMEFGQREIQVMGAFGPVYEGKGKNKKPVMITVNYVDLKESAEIDGTLISEVKQSRNGVGIKLHDKMKALEKLEKYLDLLPDHHRRKIDEEKLKLEQAKLEIVKRKVDDGEDGLEVDDGFIDALKAEAPNIWSGDNNEGDN